MFNLVLRFCKNAVLFGKRTTRILESKEYQERSHENIYQFLAYAVFMCFIRAVIAVAIAVTADTALHRVQYQAHIRQLALSISWIGQFLYYPMGRDQMTGYHDGATHVLANFKGIGHQTNRRRIENHHIEAGLQFGYQLRELSR